MLLGTARARELSHHPDERTAARCCSDAIRRVIHADTHRKVSGISLHDVCAQVSVLDPDHVHALSVHLDDRGNHQWTGDRSIAAAVRLRLS